MAHTNPTMALYRQKLNTTKLIGVGADKGAGLRTHLSNILTKIRLLSK